jgi:hypothetical protein
MMWHVEGLRPAAELIEGDLARTADGSWHPSRSTTTSSFTCTTTRSAAGSRSFPPSGRLTRPTRTVAAERTTAEGFDIPLDDLATEVVWAGLSELLWQFEVVWPLCLEHPTHRLDVCAGLWFCKGETPEGRGHDEADVGELVTNELVVAFGVGRGWPTT